MFNLSLSLCFICVSIFHCLCVFVYVSLYLIFMCILCVFKYVSAFVQCVLTLDYSYETIANN